MKKIILVLSLILFCINLNVIAQTNKKKKKRKTKYSTTASKPKTQKVIKPLTLEEKKLIQDGYFRASVKDNRNIAGCGFVLKMEDHSTLEPLNLDTVYQKQGLEIWIKFVMQKNMATICMSGQAVNIIAVKKL